MTKFDKINLMSRVIGGATLVLVPLLVVSACGKKKPAVAPVASTAPTTTWTAPPPATPTVVTPPAPSTTGPQPLDGATMQVLEVAIETRAKGKEAQYMKPVGSMFAASVSQGGTTESPPMMIEMNKCYSVVAQGGPGITELDIQLVPAAALPAGLQPVLAVDSTSGAQASISPCWKNTLPIGFPGKVVLTARGGSGAIAGKLYMK